MAERGKPIDAQTMQQIQRLRPILSLRKTAREADVSKNTVTKYSRGTTGPAINSGDDGAPPPQANRPSSV